MVNQKAKKKKVCFAASSGGHLEQLLMLRPLMERYDSFLVTEKTSYQMNIKAEKTYYLSQINRREWLFHLKMLLNSLKSIHIFLLERPDAVISTGALATIPMCLLCKAAGKKLIYIESFAKISSPTLTGRLLYRYADLFYVQWESMLEIYPNAKCLGGIY